MRVIYGLKDKTTDKIYYGKTIQHLQYMTSQHLCLETELGSDKALLFLAVSFELT